MVDLARAEGVRTGRTIGVYPEMKHPTYFGKIGLPMVETLVGALKDNGLDARDAPVFVQCFEPGPLRAFRGLSKAPTVMLAGAGPLPENLLAELAEFSDGFGPELRMVLDMSTPDLAPTPLLAQAQAAGMQVHPWTVRAEHVFLPPVLQKGQDPAAHGDAAAILRALYAAGVDGVFTDFPDLAARVRAEMFDH